MDAQELFTDGSKKADVYFCGNCRRVYKDFDYTDSCCQCRECRCTLDKTKDYTGICRTCWDSTKTQRHRELLVEAEKVSSWNDWVWTNEYGGNEGFFRSEEELLECIIDNLEEIEFPEYVHLTKSQSVAMNVDVGDIVERCADNAWDEFEEYCLSGVEELSVAIKKFKEENEGVLSYSADYKRAIHIRDYLGSEAYDEIMRENDKIGS